MLDAEFKARWVAALRSGRYPQAKGRLRTTAGFCVLGVACDVGGAGRWRPPPDGQEGAYDYLSPGEDPRYGDVPEELARRVALYPWTRQVLARRSDLGETFDALASWIETHL